MKGQRAPKVVAKAITLQKLVYTVKVTVCKASVAVLLEDRIRPFQKSNGGTLVHRPPEPNSFQCGSRFLGGRDPLLVDTNCGSESRQFTFR